MLSCLPVTVKAMVDKRRPAPPAVRLDPLAWVAFALSMAPVVVGVVSTVVVPHGFVAGTPALWLFWSLFFGPPLAALLLAAVSLLRIHNSNGQLSGRGWALAAMVLPLLIVAFMLHQLLDPPLDN